MRRPSGRVAPAATPAAVPVRAAGFAAALAAALAASLVLALAGCASPPSESATEPFTIVVVGDSVTAGTTGFGAADTPANWARILGSSLTTVGGGAAAGAARHSAAVDVDVVIDAVDDTGYVAGGADGAHTFAARIPRVLAHAPSADLLLLVGGAAADARVAGVAEERIERGIRATLEVAGNGGNGRPPVVVVGPIDPTGSGNPAIAGESEQLRQLADEFGVPFVDPVAEAWLPVGSSQSDPTGHFLSNEGHQLLAAHLRSVVASYLRQ